VPFPAGGPADLLARIVAQNLPETWKAYVDNVAGASGNIGIRTAAKAPADCHTLLLVTGGFAINPSLFRNIPYDPVRDFAPVTLAVASSHVLVVHPTVRAQDVKELIALIRANPDKYSYASPGRGQSAQLAGELFKLSTGLTDLVHVPFSGAAPAIVSTIGGHTPIAFLALPGAASNIKDGTLRALAVTGNKARRGISRCTDNGGSRPSGSGIHFSSRHFGAGGHAQTHHRPLAQRGSKDPGYPCCETEIGCIQL
jgi:tripartite-type tricarboxylate transporter receptor subunit TctC